MGNEIPDGNLFMMCSVLNPDAVAALPDRYHVRTCRRSELSLWNAMPFDDPKVGMEQQAYMSRYFHDVYAERESLFFEKCLFVCDDNDIPVGTCFTWKVYEKISTIHWYKVLKDYEGKGIGRALLSVVMNDLSADDYPVYLHTQPSSFRAIKLYSDFGFAFLTDRVIGNRKNDLDACLPILKVHMPKAEYGKLRFAKAPEDFLEAVKSSDIDQF